MVDAEQAIAPGPPDSPAGFAEWVGPHLAVLVAIAIRQVGPADAEDIVQDALVRAWRRRTTFVPERGSPRAWLVGVLLDQARRYRVRRRPQPTLTVVPDSQSAGERLDIEQAIRALPRRQREVITLHYLADLAVDEVAGLLAISAGSVKSHLFDARAALRATLEQP